jgi:cobalt-zinc-cadmium efflux system membrane fusion protein
MTHSVADSAGAMWLTRLAAGGRRWLAVALPLGLLALAAVWLFGQRAHGVAAPAAGGAPAAADTLHLSVAQRRSIGVERIGSALFHSQVKTDGRIVFNGDQLTPVYSPYSGRVTRVVAPLGALLRPGQPLFELEAAEYAQGQSDLLATQAQLKLALANEQRRHASYDVHGASLQDWQQAQSDLAGAQAAAAAARNRLRILGQSEAQIDALLESGARARARVTAAAPLAGVVVDRQLGPGQYLQAGTGAAVYTIADLSTVWLLASVREADAAAVHVGQPVTVHVTAIPEREFTTRVSYVAPTVDAATRRVVVHAVIGNADGALKPEMLANAEIQTSADVPSPAVPRQAVIYEGDRSRVWVMTTDHDVALRQIRLGREQDERLEVLQGLDVGERVVTRGALFIDRAASGE